jgi:hypothetical protein
VSASACLLFLAWSLSTRQLSGVSMVFMGPCVARSVTMEQSCSSSGMLEKSKASPLQARHKQRPSAQLLLLLLACCICASSRWLAMSTLLTASKARHSAVVAVFPAQQKQSMIRQSLQQRGHKQ